MKKPLLALLFLAQTLSAQTTHLSHEEFVYWLSLCLQAQQSPNSMDSPASLNAENWMIQHFAMPPGSAITRFWSVGDPVTGASIAWKTYSNPECTHGHASIRAFDFKNQIEIDPLDFDF